MNKKISYNTLYKIIIKWWDTVTQEDEPQKRLSYFYAFAPNLTNLAERIEHQFNNISSIRIREIDSISANDFFWADDLTPQERKHFEQCNKMQ